MTSAFFVMLGKRSAAVFAVAFLGVFVIVATGLDRMAAVLWPSMSEAQQAGRRTDNILAASQLHNPAAVRVRTAKDAKAEGLFWTANIEGAGTGLDLMGNRAMFAQLFPGYGEDMFNDKEFWRAYFRFGFGPDSFLGQERAMADQGFRVAYSWAGCFEIYKKYGADILVLGSSETYKAVIPSQLAGELAPTFGKTPRVLFCATHGMPLTTVEMTANELISLSQARPTAIIWGYSFWTSYLRSSTLAVYDREIGEEYQRYRKLSAQPAGEATFADRIVALNRYKLADYLPAISWDQVMSFSFAKARAAAARSGRPANREGTDVARSVVEGPDAALDRALEGDLKPYYGLVAGISEADCAVSAEVPASRVIDALRQLSPNVFIYVPPTTEHHRRSVPPCFIPSVVGMLRHLSVEKAVAFLDVEPAAFGLHNRDFVYPTLDKNVFYFDVNHANARGGEKVTRKLTDWLRSRLAGEAAKS